MPADMGIAFLRLVDAALMRAPGEEGRLEAPQVEPSSSFAAYRK